MACSPSREAPTKNNNPKRVSKMHSNHVPSQVMGCLQRVDGHVSKEHAYYRSGGPVLFNKTRDNCGNLCAQRGPPCTKESGHFKTDPACEM